MPETRRRKNKFNKNLGLIKFEALLSKFLF